VLLALAAVALVVAPPRSVAGCSQHVVARPDPLAGLRPDVLAPDGPSAEAPTPPA
jgi:hypothetical protein